jgi:hypothetical protein
VASEISPGGDLPFGLVPQGLQVERLEQGGLQLAGWDVPDGVVLIEQGGVGGQGVTTARAASWASICSRSAWRVANRSRIRARIAVSAGSCSSSRMQGVLGGLDLTEPGRSTATASRRRRWRAEACGAAVPDPGQQVHHPGHSVHGVQRAPVRRLDLGDQLDGSQRHGGGPAAAVGEVGEGIHASCSFTIIPSSICLTKIAGRRSVSSQARYALPS